MEKPYQIPSCFPEMLAVLALALKRKDKNKDKGLGQEKAAGSGPAEKEPRAPTNGSNNSPKNKTTLIRCQN